MCSFAELFRVRGKGELMPLPFCVYDWCRGVDTLSQSEQATKLTEELAAPLRVMQEIARRIAKVSKESKLTMDEEEYVSSFKVELMEAVIQWCRGASFSEICKV
jgi:superfamily II RNA helicase